MKIKELLDYKRGDIDQAYLDYMVQNRPTVELKPKSNIQCASTQQTLDRNPSLDEMHFHRPLDLSKAIAPHPMFCERQISAREFEIYDRMRKSSKNSLGTLDLKSLQEDRKQKAIDAFRYTPPVELNDIEKQKITKIEPITEPQYVWKKLTKWQAFKHWLKGGKISRGEADED